MTTSLEGNCSNLLRMLYLLIDPIVFNSQLFLFVVVVQKMAFKIDRLFLNTRTWKCLHFGLFSV